ncbi:type II toxin-antitoxin system RelE/ParE family toxin, partial [Corynebacterium bovis]
YHVCMMRGVVFLDATLAEIRDLPDPARQRIGYQLEQLQRGRRPHSWKAINGLPGVYEIRVMFPDGIARTLYITMGEDDSYIAPLVTFVKKSNKTPKRILDKAKSRLRTLKEQGYDK